MSRESALLAALTTEPASTSELYERIGYATLTRLGLVPYDAFRAALVRLSAAGLAAHETGGDGSTVWWLAESDQPPAARPSEVFPDRT
jgi:hypothetical protein